MSLPTMLQRLAVTGLLLLLIGCNDGNSDTAIGPAPIDDDDICHVCGMLIDAMPGPKGELLVDGDSEVTKFCSAAEMLVFLLQPENTDRIAHAWVHDMAITDWDHPGNDAFISAPGRLVRVRPFSPRRHGAPPGDLCQEKRCGGFSARQRWHHYAP